MKRYPSTSITRLSGDILAEATRSPVMITKYRKPSHVILNSNQYSNMLHTLKSTMEKLESFNMKKNDVHPEEAELEALRLFADGSIDRYEAQNRTGLYFSEMLLRMGELGINRKPVKISDRMSPEQNELFNKVFPG